MPPSYNFHKHEKRNTGMCLQYWNALVVLRHYTSCKPKSIFVCRLHQYIHVLRYLMRWQVHLSCEIRFSIYHIRKNTESKATSPRIPSIMKEQTFPDKYGPSCLWQELDMNAKKKIVYKWINTFAPTHPPTTYFTIIHYFYYHGDICWECTCHLKVEQI